MIQNILTIITLFLLEVLLSIDNAAVLAIMVKDLPADQHKKALRYGLFGAYIFRGICLLAAKWLVGLWWLKIAGGIYLLSLAYNYFVKEKKEEANGIPGKNDHPIYKWCRKLFGLNDLWLTIILVEVMDLSFSIDNIFAAVALSSKMWVVVVGVFIGIAAMRFVAGKFVTLMTKYPFMEKSAFIVIILLGFKLILAGIAKESEWTSVNTVLEYQKTDILFSICLLIVFFVPFFKNKFN